MVGGVGGATHFGAAYSTSGYEGAVVTTGATDDLTATGDGVPERSEQEGPKQRVLLVEIASRTIWQVIGGILGTLALLWAATAARGVLAVIALGFFFSLALIPAVPRLQERFGWRRGTATVPSRRISRPEGDTPGWRAEILTRSARGRITISSGGRRSMASPSTPACTGVGAVISTDVAVHARPGRRRGSSGGSRTRMPSRPPVSVGRLPVTNGRSRA